jgi:probable HAF family extracellular repeat protein
MKPRNLVLVPYLIIVAALATPVWLGAQGRKERGKGPVRYKLVEIETLGGPNSYFTFITGRSLNHRGVATGMADTPAAVNPPFCLLFPDCFLTHAFLWKDGVVTDLGALPGIGGSFVNDITANGVVTGTSLNGGTDPVLGLPYFDAVVWKDGQLIDFGTFGGPLSYANQSNERGQAVGFALNTTPAAFDLGDFCQNFPMPTQMHAFIWHDGVLRDLGTLGGTDSCALFINERGQAAGNSFTNSTLNPGTGLGVPTVHPFLWDGDEMRDLGALGNGTIATASGINNLGQVAGGSNLADDLIFHAFLWDAGKLIDLGSLGGDSVEVIGLNEKGEVVGKAQLPGSPTLHAFLARKNEIIDLGSQDGNPCSAAISINENTQIVGFSDDCSSNNAHAFLWENGHITDLNAFVPIGSSLTLTVATFINDSGEIAAEGVLPNGDQRAVLLVPCESDSEGCQTEDAAAAAQRVTTSSVRHSSTRTLSPGRFPHPFHFPVPGAGRN